MKVVVITGASSGLGKEVARLYTDKGDYKLVLCGRNAKGLEEFKNNSNNSIILGDLTKKETLELIEQEIKEKYNSQIDILINNAGIICIKPFESNSGKDFDQVLDIDLKAQMLLTQRLYPFMVAIKSGHIINVNSTSGKEARINHSLYNAAKFGLVGFTNALRLEAKKHGIRVTSFHPGGMNTEFYDEMDGVPVETYMDPKEIAKILVYLTEIDPFIAPDEIVLNRMSK